MFKEKTIFPSCPPPLNVLQRSLVLWPLQTFQDLLQESSTMPTPHGGHVSVSYYHSHFLCWCQSSFIKTCRLNQKVGFPFWAAKVALGGLSKAWLLIKRKKNISWGLYKHLVPGIIMQYKKTSQQSKTCDGRRKAANYRPFKCTYRRNLQSCDLRHFHCSINYHLSKYRPEYSTFTSLHAFFTNFKLFKRTK